MIAVALIGAGEAVADRVAGGEIEVDEAADLLESLAWRGLAGKKKAGVNGTLAAREIERTPAASALSAASP